MGPAGPQHEMPKQPRPYARWVVTCKLATSYSQAVPGAIGKTAAWTLARLLHLMLEASDIVLGGGRPTGCP
jgi:hypothetical protein